MNINIYQKLSLLLVFLLFGTNLFAQRGVLQVSGAVKTATGEAIPGVSVKIKGTSLGTVTDAKGLFSLTILAAKSVLQISYIGYLTQDYPVVNNSFVNILLQEDKKQLNEVIVTALGIKRETKTLGYSATKVTNDQLTIDRSTNLGDNLEGKVAGLNVSPPASGPGGFN